MELAEVSILIHVAMVLLSLYTLSNLGWCHPFFFFLSLLYLYKVNERYSLRLHKRIQFEEKKYASQERVLSDSESVRWLNLVVQRIWPICMEQIASKHLLLPIIPWFLQKYKPWSAKKAVVQQLYLGRDPPRFTGVRILRDAAGEDDVVLELGMDFLSAEDMSAILAVKLRKRLGFGIWANMHVTGMHVEGKVLVGLKFIPQWPFLKRVRVCFIEPPYFQMTVKPIFNRGVDVSELPGIAGWIDKLLALAFEETLVEPNMLVVDVEKFASPGTETWFTVDEKRPIAFVKLEIIEAADMQPSDLNGLADPYVNGQLGPYRFKTKIQKKTLSPKWHEEFKIPISSWEAPNVLIINVRDKDHFTYDALGDCTVKINSLRGGQRHDKWLSLQKIKTGRLHLAITILEDDKENSNRGRSSGDEKIPETAETTTSRSDLVAEGFSAEGQSLTDEFEPIIMEGHKRNGGIAVHRPNSDVYTTWGSSRGHKCNQETLHNDETEYPRFNRNSNNSEDMDDSHKVPRRSIRRGLQKIGAMFPHSSKNTSPKYQEVDGESFCHEKGQQESIGGNLRAVAKSSLKQEVSRKGSDKSKETK